MEKFFAWIKQFRGIATRCYKLASRFKSFFCTGRLKISVYRVVKTIESSAQPTARPNFEPAMHSKGGRLRPLARLCGDL
ncbi:hypothetical protein H8K52_16525 [Undibacterium seohonense]|uniref:Transposase n=1 Tax=Undibacterium seohonense TaxID=1344950 RepID=A0ABR6X7Y2_9BURK|nr:hypothetical protein [Undibacterium seohonense]